MQPQSKAITRPYKMKAPFDTSMSKADKMYKIDLSRPSGELLPKVIKTKKLSVHKFQ
jgi:hypothetical protein